MTQKSQKIKTMEQEIDLLGKAAFVKTDIANALAEKLADVKEEVKSLVSDIEERVAKLKSEYDKMEMENCKKRPEKIYNKTPEYSIVYLQASDKDMVNDDVEKLKGDTNMETVSYRFPATLKVEQIKGIMIKANVE